MLLKMSTIICRCKSWIYMFSEMEFVLSSIYTKCVY